MSQACLKNSYKTTEIKKKLKARASAFIFSFHFTPFHLISVDTRPAVTENFVSYFRQGGYAISNLYYLYKLQLIKLQLIYLSLFWPNLPDMWPELSST